MLTRLLGEILHYSYKGSCLILTGLFTLLATGSSEAQTFKVNSSGLLEISPFSGSEIYSEDGFREDEIQLAALRLESWQRMIEERRYWEDPLLDKELDIEFQLFLGGDVPDKALGIYSEEQKSAAISSFHFIYSDFGFGSTPVYHRHEKDKNTLYEFQNVSVDLSYSTNWKRSFGISGIVEATMQTFGLGMVTGGAGTISRGTQLFTSSTASGQSLFGIFSLDLGFMDTLYGVRVVNFTYKDFEHEQTGEATNQVYTLRNWMWMFGVGVSL